MNNPQRPFNDNNSDVDSQEQQSVEDNSMNTDNEIGPVRPITTSQSNDNMSGTINTGVDTDISNISVIVNTNTEGGIVSRVVSADINTNTGNKYENIVPVAPQLAE